VRLPSASSLDRAFACPPSQVYPHLRSIASWRWTRRGTVIHRFLERIPQVGLEAALAEVAPDMQEACACIEVDKLPVMEPGGYAFEVALALDLETGAGRELGRNLEREDAYALRRPTEVVGTVDVLGLLDDAVVICDYKTGFRWFDNLEDNSQLMFYALAACTAYGRSRAQLAIIRINEEGHPYFIWAEVNEEQLLGFAHRLRNLDDELSMLALVHEAGGELEPVTGDHCQYCPAVHACPAWMKLARSMTSPEDDTAGLPALTDETAPLYYEALKRGGKVLERIKSALDTYASQRPVNLEGGWVYGLHPFPRRDWDLEKAWPVLMAELGAEGAHKVISAEVVEKRIYEAFRERKKTDKSIVIGKRTDAVMEQLVAVGGLKVFHTFPVGRHRPKPEHEPLLAEYLQQVEFLRSTTEEVPHVEGEAQAGQRDGNAAGEAQQP
jgi:hypothetical protein